MKRKIIIMIMLLFLVTAAKQSDNHLSLSMTFLKLISEEILDIQVYTSDPTKILIKRDYWNDMHTNGKKLFLTDFVRYVKMGQEKHNKFKYISTFVILDSSTKEKLAQGDLTGKIDILK